MPDGTSPRPVSRWKLAAYGLAVAGLLWAGSVGVHARLEWPETLQRLGTEYASGEMDCRNRYPEPDRQSRCIYLYSVLYHRDYNNAIMTPILIALLPPGLAGLLLWVAWFTSRRIKRPDAK